MPSFTNNVYIDKIDDIVSKYNNTYHRTNKIKSIDVKPNMYINFNEEYNKERCKFKVGDKCYNIQM